MNITQVSTTPGGTLATPDGFHLVNKDDSGLFREVRYLRLPLPLSTDTLHFPAAQSTLTTQFKTFQYNAINHSNELLRASFTTVSEGHWLRVSLPAPAHITAIGLKNTYADSTHRIAIHRVDGDAIADEPTDTARSRHFGVAMAEAAAHNDILFKQGAGSGRGMMFAMSASSQEHELDSVSAANANAYAYANHHIFNCDFTGQEFALRLLNNSDVAESGFSVNWLTSLTITSYPSGPRVALVLPAIDPATRHYVLDLDNATPLWLESGELGKDGVAIAAVQNLGEAMAELLESGIKRLAKESPLDESSGFIDIALLFNSSAACAVDLPNFAIGYQGVKQGTVNGNKDKITLRFEREGGQSLPLQLSLPPDAIDGEINLTVDESIKEDHVSSIADIALLNEPITSKQNLLIQTGEKGSQLITIDTAAYLQSILIAISTLSDDAIIHLELVADNEGRSTGESLVTIAATKIESKAKHWQRLTPQGEIVLIASGHYWLTLTVERGAVNWYLAPEPGQAVYKQSTDGSERQFHDINGIHHVQMVSDSTAASEAQTLLKLGDQAFMAVKTKNQQLVYTIPLSAVTLPSIQLDLQVTAPNKGMITVYSPQIVFDFNH